MINLVLNSEGEHRLWQCLELLLNGAAKVDESTILSSEFEKRKLLAIHSEASPLVEDLTETTNDTINSDLQSQGVVEQPSSDLESLKS